MAPQGGGPDILFCSELASHHLLAERLIRTPAATHVHTFQRLSRPGHTQVRPMTHYRTLGMTSSGLLPADLAALLSDRRLLQLQVSRALPNALLTQPMRLWSVRPLVSPHISRFPHLPRLLKHPHQF